MVFELANQFLQMGYLVTHKNWKCNEFIALSFGGEINLDKYKYSGFGIGDKSNQILSSLNPALTNVMIHPHFIKFEGPCNMYMGYQIPASLMYTNTWGLVKEDKSVDYINWMPGMTLVDKDGMIGKIYEAQTDGVKTDLYSMNPMWTSILNLYLDGVRVEIPIEYLN